MNDSILVSVPQESKSALLQNHFYPPEKTTRCPWINEKGPNTGQPCGRKTFNGEQFCSAHQIVATRREGKVESSIQTADFPPEVPILPLPSTPSLSLPHTPDPAIISIEDEQITTILENFSKTMENFSRILLKISKT